MDVDGDGRRRTRSQSAKEKCRARCCVLDGWPRGTDFRRHDRLLSGGVECRDGRAGDDFRRERRRRSHGRAACRLRPCDAHRQQFAAHGLPRYGHRPACPRRRIHSRFNEKYARLCDGLRCAYRQTEVGFPHGSKGRRVWSGHLGKGVERIYRQHRRVGAHFGRSPTGLCLSAGGNADR